MRSSKGWLTPESLREGVREEYALDRGGVRHHILLEWAGATTPLPWRVSHTAILPEGVMVETHNWWFEQLNPARERWQEQTITARSIPLT